MKAFILLLVVSSAFAYNITSNNTYVNYINAFLEGAKADIYLVANDFEDCFSSVPGTDLQDIKQGGQMLETLNVKKFMQGFEMIGQGTANMLKTIVECSVKGEKKVAELLQEFINEVVNGTDINLDSYRGLLIDAVNVTEAHLKIVEAVVIQKIKNWEGNSVLYQIAYWTGKIVHDVQLSVHAVDIIKNNPKTVAEIGAGFTDGFISKSGYNMTLNIQCVTSSLDMVTDLENIFTLFFHGRVKMSYKTLLKSSSQMFHDMNACFDAFSENINVIKIISKATIELGSPKARKYLEANFAKNSKQITAQLENAKKSWAKRQFYQVGFDLGEMLYEELFRNPVNKNKKW